MNGNREIMYWQSNENWYHIDYEKDIFVMNDDAPLRAKRSFIMWRIINGDLNDELDAFINSLT